jgi:hypothetical protein
MIFQKEKTILCQHFSIDISPTPATPKTNPLTQKKKDD